MRPGGSAGRSHVADKLALGDPGSDTYAGREFRQVHVGALVAHVVLDPDAVASSRGVPSTLGHGSVAYGLDGGARRSRIVHGGVGLDLAGDRVPAAIGEAAAYAVIFERSLEEHAFQAFSALVPEGVAAFLCLEADGGGLLVAVAVEEAEMHRVDAYQLSVAHALGVDCAESVAFLKSEEVHAPLVDVREVHYEFGRASGGEHVVPERAVDGHVGVFADVLDRLGHIPDGERVAALEDGGVDLVLLVYRIAQVAGAVGHLVVGVQMVSGLDFPQVEHRVAELAESVGVGGVHAHAHHEDGEGVAVLDLHGVGFELRGLEAVERRHFLYRFVGFVDGVLLAGEYGEGQQGRCQACREEFSGLHFIFRFR